MLWAYFWTTLYLIGGDRPLATITCRTLVPVVRISRRCINTEHRAIIVALALLQTLPMCREAVMDMLNQCK